MTDHTLAYQNASAALASLQSEAEQDGVFKQSWFYNRETRLERINYYGYKFQAIVSTLSAAIKPDPCDRSVSDALKFFMFALEDAASKAIADIEFQNDIREAFIAVLEPFAYIGETIKSVTEGAADVLKPATGSIIVIFLLVVGGVWLLMHLKILKL